MNFPMEYARRLGELEKSQKPSCGPIRHILSVGFGFAIMATIMVFWDFAYAAERLAVPLRRDPSLSAPIIEEVEIYTRSKVLIIEQSEFRDPEIASYDHARYSGELAQVFFHGEGFDVTYEKDLLAEEMGDTISDFLLDKNHDDKTRLIVWIAARGVQDGDKGGIMTFDSAPKFRRGGERHYYWAESLFDHLQLISAQNALIILDVCLSDSSFVEARPNPGGVIIRAHLGKSVEFLLACRA
ncbi:MAG: caspase family protein, partial [Pseudomonadota bacterium]